MSLKKLHFKNISEIVKLTGCSERQLWHLANNTEDHYRKKEIKKKTSTDTRILSLPSPALKPVQKILNNAIVSNCDLGPYSHYGIKKRSNVTNALKHEGKKFVFTLDLKNFFPSVRPERVKRALIEEQGCSTQVANLITKLVTYDFQLPQGVSTSTTIANIVTLRLQRRLSVLAKKFGLDFTILGDDISFSGSVISGYFVNIVRKIIVAEGFTLHPTKGGIFSKSNSQMVTGVNVAHGATVGKQLRKWKREFFISQKDFDEGKITLQEVKKAEARLSGRLGYSNYVRSAKSKSNK
jgi:RNA-directed DNA polymerase